MAGEHLSIYPAVPLTSYMVRNVNVNVNLDFCFTLSCELFGRLTILGFPVNFLATIAKFQALEIVYRAHAGAVEGEVGEGKSVIWGGARTKSEVHKRELTNKMFLHSDFLTSLSSSLTPFFFTIRKLALRTNEIKRLIVYWIVMKNKSSELTRLDLVGIRLNQFGMFEERFKLLSR